jgi:hypothetical protein
MTNTWVGSHLQVAKEGKGMRKAGVIWSFCVPIQHGSRDSACHISANGKCVASFGRWWLGGNGEEGAGLDNTQSREVHWGLGKLGEWLAGGERERVHELKAAAAMARGGARWRAEGRRTTLK